MKNIKKIFITTILLTGFFFAGNQVMALGQNQNSLISKVTAITQLLDLAKEYPRLQELLQPVLDRMIADLISDINNDTKTETKKVTPKKQTAVKVAKNIKEKKQNYIDSNSELLSVTAKMYENIEGKWEISARFDGWAEAKMYVYEVDNQDDVARAVTDKINLQFNLDLSEKDIEDIIEFK